MEKINQRRRYLIAATSALGITGIGFAAVPFIASMFPSERAKALGGPVEVDIGQLEPGQLLTVEWRSRPVFVVRRTEAMLARRADNAPRLVDPLSGSNPSSRRMPAIHIARSGPKSSCSSVCARISAAFRRDTSRWEARPAWATTGRAAGSATATARSSISPGGCFATYRHRPTWWYRRIAM